MVGPTAKDLVRILTSNDLVTVCLPSKYTVPTKYADRDAGTPEAQLLGCCHVRCTLDDGTAAGSPSGEVLDVPTVSKARDVAAGESLSLELEEVGEGWVWVGEGLKGVGDSR